MPSPVIVEKRVPIFSADTLVELSRLGVKIHGGSGRLFASIEMPPGVEKETLRVLRREGFALAEPESPAHDQRPGGHGAPSQAEDRNGQAKAQS